MVDDDDDGSDHDDHSDNHDDENGDDDGFDGNAGIVSDLGGTTHRISKEGTPLHSMARTLVRLENLSFILAWTEQDPRIPGASGGYDPPIHFVEMPRL